MHTLIDYINVHTHSASKQENETALINLDIRKLPQTLNRDQYYTIGIHPWYIQDNNTSFMQQVGRYAAMENVLAIGETGIDRKINTPIQVQERIFIDHIHIAEMVNKPIIIHCVRSFNDIVRIYKHIRPSIPFIFHGYNNNLHIAKALLRIKGFYLSFGSALYQPHSNAIAAYLITPLDKLFLETDDASITISAIFAQAAEIKKIAVNELKQQMAINFKRVFSNG